MKKRSAICLAGIVLILGVSYLMVNLPFIDMEAEYLRLVPGLVAIWIAVVFLYPHMRRKPNHLLLILLVGLIATPIHAAETAIVTKDTLAGESSIQLIVWFDHLVSEFDKFISKEKKKQFIRRLTHLNDALFKLQRRKEEFLGELEVKALRHRSRELSDEMKESFEDLRQQYTRVRAGVNELGGMVSQSVKDEGMNISQSLANAASERRKGILEIQHEIESGQIDIVRIHQMGNTGIEAIKNARDKLSKVIQDLEQKN